MRIHIRSESSLRPLRPDGTKRCLPTRLDRKRRARQRFHSCPRTDHAERDLFRAGYFCVRSLWRNITRRYLFAMRRLDPARREHCALPKPVAIT